MYMKDTWRLLTVLSRLLLILLQSCNPPTFEINNCHRIQSFLSPLIYFLLSFTQNLPSVIQQRAGVSCCWLFPAFHCSPVTALPLSSVSLSGVVLLNNLFRMTQIAVRGWLTNAPIFHCRTLLSMEKHQLHVVVRLFFLHLVGDPPRGSDLTAATIHSVSLFSSNLRQSL